jgi:hypothetical protein
LLNLLVMRDYADFWTGCCSAETNPFEAVREFEDYQDCHSQDETRVIPRTLNRESQTAIPVLTEELQ